MGNILLAKVGKKLTGQIVLLLRNKSDLVSPIVLNLL